MEQTWHPSFKPFFRYTFFSSLPPYCYNYKFGYLTTFGLFLFFVRSIPLLITEREYFAEMFFMLALTVQMLLRAILFIWKRKSFEEFSKEVYKFIKDNKYNPIIQEEDYFLNIWKKNFVFKHAKLFMTFLLVICVTWEFPVFYDMATNIENAMYPYYPLYCPYFDYNSYTKVAYTLMDIILDWNGLFNVIHFEIVSMSLVSFLYCQFLYLKELLDKICVDNENDPEKIKWWIKNHCKVISFSNNLQDLFAPVIVIHYVCLIAAIASCIVVLSETSAQSVFQKYTMIVLFLLFLFELGCNCNTMEKVNELNKNMHENMYPYFQKNEELKSNVFFNMIGFMSYKPVQLSGPGFFTYTNHEFQNLVMQTYSFYSSLVSFKRN